MKKILLALAVIALAILVNIPGNITDATSPKTAVLRGASIVHEIVCLFSGLIGYDMLLASENGDDDNGEKGEGKEGETERDPLEGGIERIWNAVQLA